MQNNFLKWTIDYVRDDTTNMSWIEERKFEWVPLTTNILKALFSGKTIIIITDEERDWLGKYILKYLNKPNKLRPFLPFFELSNLYPYTDKIDSNEQRELLYDMLYISSPNGFMFWYIGKSSNRKLDIVKRKEESFLWIFDDEVQNSFHLSSIDDELDFKLLQLIRLFDKSIDAVMFADIELI
jgi:hypothetical protein